MKKPDVITVGNYQIGPENPCFIIAEVGVNHNGRLDLAHQLIAAAAATGANAVKFQTFKADQLVTMDAPKAIYQQETTAADESQFEMLRRLELPYDAYAELIAHCKQLGILFLSSPFDEQSADFLNTLDLPAFKIPSGEITNLPYLTHVAQKGKPLIVSTGMCYLSEVELAMRTISAAGKPPVVLLHCVSNYPADPVDINLRAMHTMQAAFNTPVGYSDHTTGIEIPLAAVAVGACVIEKHFTLDRTLPGPDHRSSLEPDKLAEMVQGIRSVEAALGNGRKEPTAKEMNTASAARKSLVAACDIPAGTQLTNELIVMKRPGNGLQPSLLQYIIGRTTREAILRGTVISLEMLL